MNAETTIPRRYLLEDKLIELLNSKFTDWRMTRTDTEVKVYAETVLTDAEIESVTFIPD